MDAQQKQERLWLLHRIGQIEDTQCTVCPVKNDLTVKYRSQFSPDKFCGGCMAYEEIRAIGRRLLGEVKKQKGRHMTKDETERVFEYLDKHYDRMKRDRLSDRHIAENLSVGITTLKRWKTKTGRAVSKMTMPGGGGKTWI